MAQGIILIAILLSTLVLSLQEEAASNTDYDYEDDYYDHPEPISDSEEIEDTTSVPVKPLTEVQTVNVKDPKIPNVERDREELTTEKQLSKYEVTELVIDIPDINTRRVPIITNFTITRPLNFAGESNNKTVIVGVNGNDEGDEIFNSIFVPDNPKISTNNQGNINVKSRNDRFDINKDEKDYFSNFSPKDNFDDEFHKEFDSDENDFDYFESKEEPKPKKSFKDYFHNFRKSIVNKFKSVVNKHNDSIHDSLRKIVNGPISFFNKLHKKSSDLANKFHKAVSRHSIHDKDDDVGYHDIDGYGYDYK